MFVALLSALVLVPAGFTFEPTISARAAWVAQKPVVVYCASTDQAWADELAALHDAATPGNNIFGVTPIVGGTVAYLAPQTCALLHARLQRRTVDLVTLGATLDVLTVESLHMRGEVDDGQTACDAIRTVGRFAIAKWGFRNHTAALAALLRGARAYLASQPPQYHAAGC